MPESDHMSATSWTGGSVSDDMSGSRSRAMADAMAAIATPGVWAAGPFFRPAVDNVVKQNHCCRAGQHHSFHQVNGSLGRQSGRVTLAAEADKLNKGFFR
jgi:hypothetical protein